MGLWGIDQSFLFGGGPSGDVGHVLVYTRGHMYSSHDKRQF